MLVRKICSACRKISYSLSKNGAWICPHCGTDLAALPVQAACPGLPGVLPVRIDTNSLFSPN